MPERADGAGEVARVYAGDGVNVGPDAVFGDSV